MIKQLKPLHYFYSFFPYNVNALKDYGIAVFSKYPIITQKRIITEHTVNITIYCDIVINKDTIRLYNNHLHSNNFIKNDYDLFDSRLFRYDEHQLAEIKKISVKLRDAYILRALQVDHVSEHIAHSPYPVLVCGDFNDTPVSYTYRKIRAKLNDAFKESGTGLGQTYIGVFPSYRIDYILYNDAFKAYSYKTVHKVLSDHYPIVAQLYFKEKY